LRSLLVDKDQRLNVIACQPPQTVRHFLFSGKSEALRIR
jgi:hypothetical protein